MTTRTDPLLRFYSPDAEAAVLGTILLETSSDPAIVDELLAIVTPEDFHDGGNRAIFKAMISLHRDGQIADPVLVAQRVNAGNHRTTEVSVPDIISLIDNRPLVSSATRYAQIVSDQAGRRRLWLESQSLMTKLLSGDYDGVPPDTLRSQHVQRLQHAVKPPTLDFSPATWRDLDGLCGPVTWSWPGWLPDGFLSMLCGTVGVGKSILALRLCETFIEGRDWPDGTPYEGETGSVLWCESESAQTLNLERAKAWDMDLTKILVPSTDPLVDVVLDDPDQLKRVESVAWRPDVRFIVVDSLSGSTRRNENHPESMALVQWLARLARDTEKPMEATHHLRKRGLLDSNQGINLERVRGYSGLIQPARIVMAMDTPDALNEETKRLSIIKSNLGRFPEALGLQISDEGISFCDAPTPPRITTVVDQAIEALRDLLHSGPLPTTAVLADMHGRGISEATARRAKRRLGIVAKKASSGWLWGLPTV